MSATLLWYLARGSGLALLPVLTGVVVLGLLSRSRVRPGATPRVALVLAHRSLSLLAVALLVVHVSTIVADGSVDVGFLDVVVPFASGYEAFWTGLGTLSLLAVGCLVVTSLLRVRLGRRVWTAFHLLGWAVWPTALAHGLGVGSDTTTGWGLGLTLVCVAAFAAAVVVRVRAASHPVVRTSGPLPGVVTATGPLPSAEPPTSASPTAASSSAAPAGTRPSPSADHLVGSSTR